MSSDQSTWPLVRFRVIKDAWGLYKRHALIWSATVLIMMAANACVDSVIFAILGKGRALGPGGFRLFLPAAGALGYILSTTVSGFFAGGMIRMAGQQIRGRAPRFEDLFSITDCWFDLVLVSFLIGLSTWAGLHLCIIPGFIIHGLFMLAIPLVVEGRLPATGALIQSWQALKSQWLTAAVFHWLLIIVAVSGILLCFFGVLLTGPLYSLSVAILYQNYFGWGPVVTSKKPSDPFPEV
jgi:hypothetical protein